MKTVTPAQLPDFLREHYTTGPEMAQMLSSYLMSNRGAAVDRPGSGRRGAKPEPGANLRSDAPVGLGAPAAADEREPMGGSRSNKRLPKAGATRPDAAEAAPSETPAGRPRGRRQQAVQPPEASPLGGAAEHGVKDTAKTTAGKHRRKGEPKPVEQETPAAAAEPATAAPKGSARSIDAAVPVPEPVTLPPPTAADVKPSPPVEPAKPAAAQAKPTEEPAPKSADKMAVEKPVAEKPAAEPSAPEKAAAEPSKPAAEPAKPASGPDKAEASRPVPTDAAASASGPLPPISR